MGQLLTMLRPVLSCLLATQFVDSKPQWQHWPQLYQPYHYTQYTLPIYSQNYLREAAVTGHFPGSNQKVTPYWSAINFDSPRYFQAFCDAKNRKFGALHALFDKNGDGNGSLDKNDFECLAVRNTVIEGKGDWNEATFKKNQEVMANLWNEIAELADFNKDGEVDAG